MQSGTVYTWGKGEHEKPKFNDYLEYSSPFVILEEKQIQHLSFGRSHVMALDRFGKLYGWGDGGFGCLGFGDNKRRATPQPLHFFNDNERKVVDVACGDTFTCVIVVISEELPAY
jgi:alpha-tubulin suppressor-like RCC1 family protein